MRRARGWAAMVGAAAMLAVAGPAMAERIEKGALVLENVPEAPAALTERLNQYVNVRAASFQGWLPSGGVLISTRFGDAAQLHKVETPLGARTQLTFYPDRIAGAAVQPGGAGAFAFAKDSGGDEFFQAYLFDPKAGRALQFSEPGTRNQSAVWSQDGKRIAWTRATAQDPNYDILVADAADPASRTVALEGTGQVFPIDWSPDGSQLLLGRYISVAESKRFLLDLTSGAVRELTPKLKVSYDGGEFLPDGRSIILLSDEGSQFARLVELDLDTGKRTPLTPKLDWDVESFALSKDGRVLAYSVNEAGLSKLTIMDLRTKRALPQPDLPPGIVGGLEWDDAGRRLGFTFTSAQSSGDVWSFDLETGGLTRWTQSEIGGLDPQGFVTPELIRWTSFDKKEITGFLYKPKGEGPFPVIVTIHGGPEGQFRPGFSSTLQYWVNEMGVAVIAPNVRGSSGYGKDFLALDNGMKREDSVRDIGALLDWIEASSDLDASRVMVHGGSYGGYMVYAAATTYPERLAGAISVVGISNFVTFLENTMGYRRDLRRVEYGDERDPKMRAHLQKISPLTNAARITKPLFIVQGLNDPRVPASEAEQMLAAVRANGAKVWYMAAKDEGHGFAKKANQEAQRAAEAQFISETLGLAPQGAAAK